MRLLNSVCKVISSKYAGVPVHIGEVPNNFKRGCFYVHIPTEDSTLKNLTVYEENPLFQIVYFGKRNEANQVIAEELYDVASTLKALFLLRSSSVPIVPLEGVKEKPRYAKIESYNSAIRMDEGAVYVKLTLSFTEDTPKENPYTAVGEIDFETETVTNG